MEKRRIIDLNISLISYREALTSVLELAKKRIPSYVCFANGHMSIEAHWNKQFADYVNRASLVLTDGVPLTVACRILHGKKQERIAGMDFMPSILGACNKEHLSIFLFGSTTHVLDTLAQKIRLDYPALIIVGIVSPPFREFTPTEDAGFVDVINNSKANVVLVGMGCPRQETWMALHSKDINSTLLGVGGAFSVYAGLTKRAPVWMQRFSLEWLYRLIQEPKRMWKRYLVTNILFIFLVAKQFILGLSKNKE